MNRICTKGLQVEVMPSYAGYYIGTSAPDEELDGALVPHCRLSVEYYKKREDAEKALEDGTFRQRVCMENEFCNCGTHCLRR